MITCTESSYKNLADFIPEIADSFAEKDAILFPKKMDSNGISYESLNFRELNFEIQAYARGLKRIGIKKGMRVSFMVKPSLEFLPLTYALFKIGAVPVFIDPGMGKKNLLRCIEASAPEAFIGIPRAQIAKILFPSYFKTVKINVTIGRTWFWGGHSLKNLRDTSGETIESSNSEDDLAAIIYTTGSTGPPKGVEYTHKMFMAQRESLKSNFQLTEKDVDMPAFALFSIFTLAIGCTIVIPEMDQTRPAQVTPDNIIKAIQQNQVSFSFGSPALWNTVSLDCQKRNIQFPSLKSVVMAGAPIPPYLHRRMLGKIINKGEIYTPYGATECLPVSSFEGSKVLAETAHLTADGKGYCVGKALDAVEIKVIKISDQPIKRFADCQEMATGQIGEIIVKGNIVSRRYFNLPDKTTAHKIYETDDEANGPFWHRIGDLGYIDENNRIWMCGRQTHRVETASESMYTVCCEAISNQHDDVFRSALVGIGNDRYQQKPILIIEPVKDKNYDSRSAQEKLISEVKELTKKHPLTKNIETVLVHLDFPVDIRHNAKIFREKLSIWAESELTK